MKYDKRRAGWNCCTFSKTGGCVCLPGILAVAEVWHALTHEHSVVATITERSSPREG